MFGMLSMMISHATAAECYMPSPNITRLGDDYYALDKQPPLSNEENNQINILFDAIAGEWKGDMQYLECRGPDSAPLVTTRTASITANMKLSSIIGLDIHAQKLDIENRIIRPEHVALIGNTPVFDLEFYDSHHIVFAERYRRLNQIGKKEQPTKPTTKPTTKPADKKPVKPAEPVKQKTSRITETIYEVRLNGGSLYLARFYYTNGVYVGEESWHMQRD